MATTTARKVLFSGHRRSVHQLTASGDTDLSGTILADLSAEIGPGGPPLVAPSDFIVEKLTFTMSGANDATVAFNETTDDVIAILSPGDFEFDYGINGIRNGQTGGTGDIIVTTTGAVVGFNLTLTVYCRHQA